MKKSIKMTYKTLTIETAFENFLTLKKSEGRSTETLRAYRTQAKCFLNYCEAHKITKVEQINFTLINAYKSYLVDRKDLTPDTRASYLRVVKCFANYLMESEEIESFKIKSFSTPSKTHVSTYSDEEIKKLINCKWSKSKEFSEYRDYVLMVTLLLTGARRSTVLGMKISDVDFTNDLLTLGHIKRDNTFQIRQIPLNPDLRPVLEKYLRKTGIAKQCEYLFPNVSGDALHPDTVNKRMEKLFNAADVEFRGCHEFRRTFATKSYNALGDLNKTQKLMMISDPRILQRYVNTDMKVLQDSVQELTFITQIKAPRNLRGALKKGA